MSRSTDALAATIAELDHESRGFAVVADEVRALSRRIQGQITRIHQQVRNLQAGAANAVSAIEGSREQSVLNLSLTERAGAALDAIHESVTVITEMNKRIVGSTCAEDVAMRELADGVQRVNDLAGCTLDVVDVDLF